MDLKQLQYFLCVVDQGSFTKAARMLDVAQPALSRQVRLLEVELRQNLLTRTGRGVVATEAGKLLAQHGHLIMHQVDIAHEELDKLRGNTGGHVTVGLPTGLSKLLAVKLISEVRTRLPNAQLSVSDGLSVSMQESILNGRLDMALLYRPQPSPDIDTTPIMKEELYLVYGSCNAGKNSPITLRDVSKLPLIIPQRPHEIRNVVETKMTEVGCKPNIMLEVDGVSAILDVLATGPGYAILPLYAVAIYSKLSRYHFQPIISPALESTLSLATSSKRQLTSTQKAVEEIVLEICHDTLVPAIEREMKDLTTELRTITNSTANA
ncbi:hypothetical protein CJO09_06465 [Neopusillimonas maritima]|uniref:HTH lysR-type domain-containing protein n=2 Tax=Neopusillimonas maritima TaxID=2026239 RepID=A0ABX9MWJ0_9BURK|nr:hypothetical protein CJO09_06465 [Neopusillimonas maritima]